MNLKQIEEEYLTKENYKNLKIEASNRAEDLIKENSKKKTFCIEKLELYYGGYDIELCKMYDFYIIKNLESKGYKVTSSGDFWEVVKE